MIKALLWLLIMPGLLTFGVGRHGTEVVPELAMLRERDVTERFVTEWQDVALEFQVAADGSVTGVVLEQQGERYPGKRLPE